MKLFKTILTLALLAIVSFAPQAFAGDFMIVVNAGNGSAPNLAEIKNLYLKKKTSWSGGEGAVPLGRKPGSAEQEAFLSVVLGMSQADSEGYWASEKAKTGATAPREVGSATILLRQVSRKDGAFGVVSASDAASLPDGVKVLTTF